MVNRPTELDLNTLPRLRDALAEHRVDLGNSLRKISVLRDRASSDRRGWEWEAAQVAQKLDQATEELQQAMSKLDGISADLSQRIKLLPLVTDHVPNAGLLGAIGAFSVNAAQEVVTTKWDEAMKGYASKFGKTLRTAKFRFERSWSARFLQTIGKASKSLNQLYKTPFFKGFRKLARPLDAIFFAKDIHTARAEGKSWGEAISIATGSFVGGILGAKAGVTLAVAGVGLVAFAISAPISAPVLLGATVVGLVGGGAIGSIVGGKTAETIWPTLNNGISNLSEGAAAGWDATKDAANDAWDGVSGSASSAWNAVGGFFKSSSQTEEDQWESTSGGGGGGSSAYSNPPPGYVGPDQAGAWDNVCSQASQSAGVAY